jgi:hypothetical protein
MPNVMAKERAQKTPATLADVLYAKSKAQVPEQDWVTLVQSMVPPGHVESVKQKWTDYYWKPLRTYLAKHNNA